MLSSGILVLFCCREILPWHLVPLPFQFSIVTSFPFQRLSYSSHPVVALCLSSRCPRWSAAFARCPNLPWRTMPSPNRKQKSLFTTPRSLKCFIVARYLKYKFKYTVHSHLTRSFNRFWNKFQVTIGHKKAPSTLIDDCIDKFHQHEVERKRLRPLNGQRGSTESGPGGVPHGGRCRPALLCSEPEYGTTPKLLERRMWPEVKNSNRELGEVVALNWCKWAK